MKLRKLMNRHELYKEKNQLTKEVRYLHYRKAILEVTELPEIFVGN